jgi:hypothetical protein
VPKNARPPWDAVSAQPAEQPVNRRIRVAVRTT